MKSVYRVTLCFALCFGLVVLPAKKSHAIIWVVVKAAAKKVIKALDLQVQRLQNKTIVLQNAQKTLENTLSKLKLQEIASWTEKQRKLYAGYFDELWKVKNAIATYKKIKEVVQQQIVLVDEYKKVYAMLRKDIHFAPDEVDYMYRVYSGILAESLKNVDQLLLVVNSFSTQMSDGKRLEIISNAAAGIEENMTALRQFTNRNIGISMQRAQGIGEVEMIKRMYGLPVMQ
ncbi:conjugal transfer protein TraI [Chitinophaga oryzae]|uniref:Conjugal transfer protein TraI n=1 Tax=Chitinophaga oryzae TaxID=2725414 RepID=A0AAE7D5T1_9BACT|nr:conjugal transfer protein TraI [Chitinophaga oryzae]QJB29922.1 conjugal transfer protein TraI [Chitinophaga oryzae]